MSKAKAFGVEAGQHVLRVVVDVVQQCNLRCTYCHPGKVWEALHLDLRHIEAVFDAVESSGALELVVSGGEPTLHPNFDDILSATHGLRRTASVLVTNATRIDDRRAQRIAASNLTRVCVSLDGADDATHSSARGDNRARVVEGLRRIRATGLPVTVISVVHRGNVERLIELSEWLAESGLADQHHMCAPSYSGEARLHYPSLRLELADYFRLQDEIDAAHEALAGRGLYVTFNSFWPATGRRSPVVDGGRRITLQQVVEQVKGSLVHVRPDGELRLAAMSWGRATVGTAAVGNVCTDDVTELLYQCERRNLDGTARQLPREVEAVHKFQLGGAEPALTAALIDSDAKPDQLADLVPLRPLSHLGLFDNSLTDRALDRLALQVAAAADDHRLVRHPTGKVLVYDRRRSHVTLLHEHEWPRLLDRHRAQAGAAAS